MASSINHFDLLVWFSYYLGNTSSTALVLWKPPGGFLPDLINQALKSGNGVVSRGHRTRCYSEVTSTPYSRYINSRDSTKKKKKMNITLFHVCISWYIFIFSAMRTFTLWRGKIWRWCWEMEWWRHGAVLFQLRLLNSLQRHNQRY